MTKPRSVKRIFVSYSSADNKLVGAIVELIRLMKGGVFFAPDSIELGAKWPEELQRAIREARLLLLIWCEHSANSDHVKAEYQYAMAFRKPIVPAILDNTPLPPELREYQRIDVRVLARHLPTGSTLRNETGNYDSQFAGFAEFDSILDRNQRVNVFAPATEGLIGVALALLALLRPLPPLPDRYAHFTDLVNALAFAGALAITIGSVVRAYNRRPHGQSASVTGYEPSPAAIVAQSLEVSLLLAHEHRAL